MVVSLSISSSRNTGFEVPAVFMPFIMRPGIAPMYVFLWPRISASSSTPPRLMRTNLRPRERAMELATEVLPVPGGPTKHSMGAFMPPVSFNTARYSVMRSFIFSRP